MEKLELDFGEDTFDCMVCGDVLEHLREPEQFLRRARGWLSTDGCVVVSLPNVRHHSVVSSLLEGNWSYEPAGLLDETHLRFFTRRDMVDLFERAGFQITNVQIVPGPGYEEWHQSGCPGEVRVGRLHIADTAPEEAEEFFVYQYLLVAQPGEAPTNDTSKTNGKEFLGHHAAKSAARKPAEQVRPARRSVCVATASETEGPSNSRETDLTLRISFLGNFEQDWSTERYAADALERVGHAVNRIHEYGVKNAAEVIEHIREFHADCLIFFKGRIGVDHAMQAPS